MLKEKDTFKSPDEEKEKLKAELKEKARADNRARLEREAREEVEKEMREELRLEAEEKIKKKAMLDAAQKKANQEEKKKEASSRREPKIKVRVFRIYGDEEEKNMPIEGGANHKHEMFSFMPGTVVELNKTQLGILKGLTHDDNVTIPLGSGIYQHPDPRSAACKQYPEHQYTEDPDGTIVMRQKMRLYSVENE